MVRFYQLLFGLTALGGLLLSTAIAQTPRKPDRKAPAPLVRTWSDTTGKYRVRATLIDFDEKQVRLKRPDGEEITVPLERLSETDRKWLARQTPGATQSSMVSMAEGEWPNFLGPNRDAKSPDTGLLKQWPGGGPPLLWQVDSLGSGYSSPVISGGRVYINGEVEDKHYIHAFDLDGKPLWKVEHGPSWKANFPGSRGSPTIDSGNLYLLSGTGVLGCYEAETGRRRWVREAREFGGEPSKWGYAESVLVWQGMVIFKPGGQNCIVALDKTTGKPIWTSKGFAAAPEYSSCLPVVHDRVPLIITGTRAGIVAVSAQNGMLVWSHNFSADNMANCPTPAYSDGHVFWSNFYGKGAICLKLEPGGKYTAVYTSRNVESHHGGYVISKGHVYGGTGRGWACIDFKTGEEKWAERGPGKGSLCWADDMLYIFSENGGHMVLAECSPKGLIIKGALKVDGEGSSWAHPIVIGGRLYVRYDQNLYCFNVKAE